MKKTPPSLLYSKISTAIFLSTDSALPLETELARNVGGLCILPRYYIYLCPTRPTFNPAVHEMFIDALARI